MRARVSPRQPARSRIRRSMSSEPDGALAPDFGVDLGFVADLRGLLAPDATLDLGFAFPLATVFAFALSFVFASTFVFALTFALTFVLPGMRTHCRSVARSSTQVELT